MCYTEKAEKTMYKFFAFLDRMKYIKRWSLMRSVREENIMEHTEQVAVIAHALALIGNRFFGKNADAKEAALYALYHETGEVITGDLPTPIKYFNEDIRTAYKDLETKAGAKLLAMLPPELAEEYGKYVLPDTEKYEYKLAKAADKISAYLKCVEEVKAGNPEFKKAKAATLKAIKGFDMEEVKYFMENIAPAYELTLDELD